MLGLADEPIVIETEARKGRKKRDSSILRKAPNAPKRFKSSYICFFMAKQPEIKEELGQHASVSAISKRSAELWKDLPAEERAHWDDVAAKDKQRYMMEKSTYTGPWQVPWKRAKRDPSAPKRPMSAFLLFTQGRRAEIKKKYPDMKNTEVSRVLGDMWHNLSDQERAPFQEEEKKNRAEYLVAVENWRKENEAKKEEQQRAQAVFEQQHMEAAMAGLADLPDSHFAVGIPTPFAPFPPLPVGAYQYPTTGKHPIILGPNGMPHFPQMQAPVTGFAPQMFDEPTNPMHPNGYEDLQDDENG